MKSYPLQVVGVPVEKRCVHAVDRSIVLPDEHRIRRSEFGEHVHVPGFLSFQRAEEYELFASEIDPHQLADLFFIGALVFR